MTNNSANHDQGTQSVENKKSECPDKVRATVSVSDGSFFQYPALKYSVCNMRMFMPTQRVLPSQNCRYSFKEELDEKIEELSFIPMYETKKMTIRESLQKNHVDGILVLHKGKISYEKYFNYLDSLGTHAVMSVSKSFTGTLGAMLVAEGVLDEHQQASYYVPELTASAFGDATIRNLLDMTTALKYSEDYSDPTSDVYIFSGAGTPCKSPDYSGPSSYRDYLKSVKKEGEHGKAFAYKTINVDALAWVITAVTGKCIPQLLSERIWQPIGAQIEGYYQVDETGVAFAGGGFNAALRDLAMFGEMMRNKGYFNGKQILPSAVYDDIVNHCDADQFDKKNYPNLKGWAYRNMWWVSNNEDKAFCARGVYGQTIYIDPVAEMVLVRLASHPSASNAVNDPYSLPAYQTIADYLKNRL